MNELSIVREMQWWPSRCVSVSRVRSRKLLESHHTYNDVLQSYTICIAHQKQYIESNHTHKHTPSQLHAVENLTTPTTQISINWNKTLTSKRLWTDFRFYFTWLTSNALGCTHRTTSNQFSPQDMCIVAGFRWCNGQTGLGGPQTPICYRICPGMIRMIYCNNGFALVITTVIQWWNSQRGWLGNSEEV